MRKLILSKFFISLNSGQHTSICICLFFADSILFSEKTNKSPICVIQNQKKRSPVLSLFRRIHRNLALKRGTKAMEEIQHRTVEANGINIHIAEKGQGPIILFLHGFPELWYSWRHQIHALASLGYRAVAPDLRGFGDTDAPADGTSYTSLHVVGDIIGVLDAIGADRVFVVGHDWGAVMAWYLCLYRPDRVKALVNMSVPFSPRNPMRKPLESLRAQLGDDYYICRFQVPFPLFPVSLSSSLSKKFFFINFLTYFFFLVLFYSLFSFSRIFPQSNILKKDCNFARFMGFEYFWLKDDHSFNDNNNKTFPFVSSK